MWVQCPWVGWQDDTVSAMGLALQSQSTKVVSRCVTSFAVLPCNNLLRLSTKRLKSERGAAKYKNIWLLGNGLCFENKLQKETFYCFPLLGISKQQQEDIAVSPQYWARAAASKVVEQQASPKISNFPFWFSQNQKTNSILRKGFEIENSIAVMSTLNCHNKGPYKRSFWFQHLCSPTTNKETNNSLSSFF